MGAESYTIFPELALIVHCERLARFVVDEIKHCRDRAVRFDRLAHDLAALRQVFVRDRLRRGQVRALRRGSVLIRENWGSATAQSHSSEILISVGTISFKIYQILSSEILP